MEHAGLPLPLALGALLAIGNALGLGDLDFDADVDLDADADLDADGDGDAEGDAGVLAVLGVGRVPLMVVLTTLFTSFGVVGLSLNRLLTCLLPQTLASLAALALSAFISVRLTGRVARLIARLLPSVESYASQPEALIGCSGHASLPIDTKFGRASVLDDGGTRHELRCRTTSAPITGGTELVVTDYDASSRLYTVEPLNL
jgi:hypothetical protein